MISARLADRLGFAALYMTGYGVTASHLGLPDAGLASYAEMVSRAQTIAAGSATPLIADADTGYGGLLNVQRTVRGYEAAGVAAIQLEDQEFPKKCGHTEGRRVIPLADMVRKIEVAVESRSDPDFLIVARTDARTSLGLDEALRRAEAYRAAGADVLFVESPENESEFERIGQTIDAPLLAKMVESGRSPVLSTERLAVLGFTIALYPGTGFLAAAHTLERVYGHLQAHGTSLDLDQPLTTLTQMNENMGFESVWEFDRRWAET
jgi:2-methylisocitrate lyase-like PEP mutase family enzyme